MVSEVRKALRIGMVWEKGLFFKGSYQSDHSLGYYNPYPRVIRKLETLNEDSSTYGLLLLEV